MKVPTAQAAKGKWQFILRALGIPADALRPNKKQPCPLCGGKDRYRFTDKGEGYYFCQQCGEGGGFTLLAKFHKWTWQQAAAKVDEVLGNAPSETQQNSSAPPTTTNAALTNRLLNDASDPTVVKRWLASRRLTVSSSILRGHPACAFFDDNDRRLVDHFPAVIAPVFNPDGTLVTAQRLYLSDTIPKDQRKKLMPTAGSLQGSAVRLFELADEIGVAEGVATALAAREIFGIPTWACLDAVNLKRFRPPAGIERLHVFGDNDRSFTGQAAAFELARISHRDGLEVAVNIPPEPDSDWNDVLAGMHP